MNDIKRNLEPKITELMRYFPAVAILGARQTGKTTLAKRLLPDWAYIDLEKPNQFERISYDPEFYFQEHSKHIIIDEAQRYPLLFDVLRGVIDANSNEPGRFLLTGSSSPDLLKHASESLAGRVAIVQLGTLKANEYYQQPLSPFYQLFDGKLSKDKLPLKRASLTREQMQYIWLKGGYPKPLLTDHPKQYLAWMENYFLTYVSRDISELFPRLNKMAYQRFIRMLSQLSGTIINKSDLGRALEVNYKTVQEYLTIAEGTFLWRQLTSYEKNIVKSIIKMPKGYYRDSGLLHYFLNITGQEDLYNHPSVGHSFESFVIEEIIKGLQATDQTQWQAHYYRTRNGAEIDLILEGNFGILPIEIKYGVNTPMKQLKTLSEFVKDHQLPFGMLINQADRIEWLTPEIVQVPVNFL